MTRHIRSMYWDNIDHNIPQLQKRVFNHLGFDIEQDENTGVQHGDWMDQVLSGLDSQDTVLFVDIDCIPLNRKIVTDAFDCAEAGHIFGSAQTANHLPDSDFIYAAPSFLGLSAQTWNRLDRVSMKASPEVDVGMSLTKAARAKGITVDLLFPTFVGRPQWRLGSMGVVGFATFYQGAVFHLFQARHNKTYEFAFPYVANCILSNQPIRYLELARDMNSCTRLLESQVRDWSRNIRRSFSSLKHFMKAEQSI